jgi:PAS domain S-box-containing protein
LKLFNISLRKINRKQVLVSFIASFLHPVKISKPCSKKENFMLQKIKKLFTPPTFENDPVRTNRARNLNPFLLSGLALSAMGTLIFIIANPVNRNQILPYGIIATLGIAIAIILMKKGFVHLASIGFVSQIWIIIIVQQIQYGQPISSFSNLIPALILMSALLLPPRAAFTVILLSIVANLGIFLAVQTGTMLSSTPTIPYEWEMAININISIFTAILALLSVRALQGARDQAQQEQNFNKAILDTQNALVVMLDPEGRVEFFNHTSETLSGYTTQEVLGKPLVEILIPSEEKKHLGIFLANLPAPGNSGKIQNHWVCKNGEKRLINWNNGLLFDAKGELVHIISTGIDITEKTQIEENLELTRFAVEHAAIGAFLIDHDGNIQYANQKACEELEYSPENFIGQPLALLDRDYHISDHSWNVLKDNQTIVMETTHKKRDGEKFPVEIIANYLEFGGKVYNWTFSQNITERKENENRLKESETRFRRLVENSPLPILVHANSKIVFINQAAIKEMGGVSISEFLNKDLLKFVHTDHHTNILQRIHSAKDNDSFEAVQEKFIRLDGSFIDVEVRVGPIEFEGQDATQLVFHNITIEKKMREMADSHALFPDENPNPVLRIAPNGTLIYANPMSHTLLKKWQCTIGEEIPTQWREQVKQSLQQNQVIRVEENLGDLVYAMALAPIQGANYVNLYGSNITERKKAEKELRAERANLGILVEESTQELRLANKELARNAQLKDEFMASMSHELRTPLNAILGMSEALQEQVFGPLNDKQLHYLETIGKSGLHLLSLINDILDISKIEAGEMQLIQDTIQVEDICRASIAFISETASEKHLNIHTSLEDDIPPFTADSLRLKQILINLLSNAVKFTPEGGSIGIEAQVNKEKTILKFIVWDTGIGIAEKDSSRLFKPFVQLDSSLSRQYNGTGLGLALVFSLTKLHGGGVSMESEPGQGTRFTISLPLIHPASQLNEHARTTQLTAPKTIQKAIVVDKTPNEAAFTTRLLEELGVEVSALYSGKNVMQQALKLKPDVIIMGLLLPETSGWTALEQLQKDPRTRHIPIILVTVVEDHNRGLTLGAVAHLVKPVHRYELFESLQKAAKQKESFTPRKHNDFPNNVKTILMAEDNESNIETIADFLEINGYQIRIVRTGLEALDSINQNKPDLILMDIQMPGLNGVETIRRIREDPSIEQMPIIALTALAMPGDRERCLRAGANKYMSKPVQLKELLNLITSLL